jgi:hypothetical protein
VKASSTLVLGAAIIVAAEALLIADVEWVAIHMTPLCWSGFLLLMDGVLARRRGGSPARLRPRLFWTCYVTSVGVWVFFDWVNFGFIHAWDYVGLDQLSRPHAWAAKLVAFAAISPAMFLCAELFQDLGTRRIRGPAVRVGPIAQLAMFVIGVPALLFPFAIRDPVGSLTLWVALILVLDPLNAWLGRGRVPTLIGDWSAGRYGRTVALMAGGLACGFLWEFWNYWAAAKWVYDLPFLGPLEQYRLFEMPIPGFGGFGPFALESWVAFQSILLLMHALRLRFVEPLPDDNAVL